jgi:hypothetical protein
VGCEAAISRIIEFKCVPSLSVYFYSSPLAAYCNAKVEHRERKKEKNSVVKSAPEAVFSFAT